MATNFKKPAPALTPRPVGRPPRFVPSQPGTGATGHGHILVILVALVLVVILYIYIQKNGGLGGYLTTLRSPKIKIGGSGTGTGGNYNAAGVGTNVLTQADFVKKFPRQDGKSDRFTITVPNITFIDRFGPGDTWQRNSDGAYFTRVGNTQNRLNGNAGSNAVNWATLDIGPQGQFLSSDPYNDMDWNFGAVMGDTDAAGNATEQWNSSPRGLALKTMGQNLEDIQQAYDDYGQHFAGYDVNYLPKLATDNAALTRVFGSNWPSWTKGTVPNYKPGTGQKIDSSTAKTATQAGGAIAAPTVTGPSWDPANMSPIINGEVVTVSYTPYHQLKTGGQ